jgi:hypothetical protein
LPHFLETHHFAFLETHHFAFLETHDSLYLNVTTTHESVSRQFLETHLKTLGVS